MLIRRCNFDDRAELAAAHALQRAAYEIEAALIGTREIPGLSESVHELAASREMFYGCFDGPRLAGVIATEEEGGISHHEPGLGAHIRISRLAIDPARFRRGVGRMLVGFVLGDRRRTVRVSTGVANRPARALYESEGFRLTGEREVGRVQRVKIAEYQWG